MTDCRWARNSAHWPL